MKGIEKEAFIQVLTDMLNKDSLEIKDFCISVSHAEAEKLDGIRDFVHSGHGEITIMFYDEKLDNTEKFTKNAREYHRAYPCKY